MAPSRGRTIALHGSLSNTDGVHATLTTPSGEQRLVRGGGRPYAGGVVRETVSLPSGTLLVRWPSGITQEIDAGAGPVLDVVEPEVASVTPRRVPAGGGQSVAVEVDPAAIGQPSAPVSVTASAGTWSKPVAKDADGVYRGTLSVPAAPTTVVIEIEIGGSKLRVRPRVFVR